MAEKEPPPSLTALDAKLRAAQGKRPGVRKADTAAGSIARDKMGVGFRIAIELVAGVVAGTAIGLGLDNWLGTKPWLLILFFVIGAAAGFLNVYRVARAEDKRRAEARRAGGSGGPEKN